jgi:SNF2 family DNA or RNA helicase
LFQTLAQTLNLSTSYPAGSCATSRPTTPSIACRLSFQTLLQTPDTLPPPKPRRFLRYEPFNHPKYFKQHIKEEITHNPAKGFRKLQALLRAVLLRRTKGSKIGGQPIIALPERRQQLLKVEFSRDESVFYKQVRGLLGLCQGLICVLFEAGVTG